MKVRAFQLLYRVKDNEPVDDSLYRMAIKFIDEQLATPVDLHDLRNCWIACEVDEHDKPVRCLGMLGMVQVVDFAVARFLDNVACKLLVDRANDYLHDQGLRGSHVFVHIFPDEKPEQMCPDRDLWLKAFKMEPANRWMYTIK